MPDTLWINAVSGTPAYTARELRRAQAAWYYPYNEVGTDGRLDVRPGVRPGGSVVVTVSSFTATVNPFAATVAPRLSETQGSYVVQHTGTTHTIDPASSSNPRRDIVVVRIYDDDEDASGRREAVTEYIAGEPASSPTKPATPSGAMELAVIDVPIDGSGDPVVTNTAPFSVASGGVLPARDSSEYPTGGRYVGQPVFDQSSEELKVRVPGEWVTFGVRWDRGFVLEDTNTLVDHGGASRGVQQRYWTRLADKLIWCNWYVTFNSSGSGSQPVKLEAPTDIDRTGRQIVQGYIERTNQIPTGRPAVAVAFSGGSGNLFDRIRWTTTTDDPGGTDTTGMESLNGAQVTPDMLVMFSGIYREP